MKISPFFSPVFVINQKYKNKNYSDIFVIVSCVFLYTVSCSWAIQEYPKVSVLKWMTAESQDWEYDNLTSDAIKIQDGERETIFTVSQHLMALAIVCNSSSYPVQWVFDHFDRVEMYNIRMKTYRWAENVYDPKTFKFSSVLEMYSDTNHMTGAYSCQKTSSPKIQNNIFIYWLGNSPPYLVHAGKTLMVKSEDNKTLILPCVVSSPDVEVILSKQTAGDYVEEPASPYIKYDPQIGFSLNLEQYDSPYGSYKCAVEGGDDDEDFVLMTALPGIETKYKINNYVDGNASFTYDPINRQIKCCSTSAKPPNLRNVFCEDAITCKLKEFSVLTGGNNGIKFRNSSCTVDRVYYRDSGVFRCKGDGIDIVRHFFSGFTKNEHINDTNPVYFTWSQADPSKLLTIEPHLRPANGKIYSNMTVIISCDTSYYYFGEGIHWALKWKNGTIQFLNESYTAYQGNYHRSEMMHTIKFQADVKMESLTCFAPVWNTTEFFNTTYNLDISPSSAPILKGPVVEELFWSLNQTDKSINCIVESGKPTPLIRWRKNNRILLNDTNTTVRRQNGSSYVKFKRVSHGIQGEYKCIAGNVAGRIEKIIRINVDVPSSSWGAVSITLTTLIVLGLLGGIGFLVWKMNLQKKIIDHLAGVVFRDMGGSSSSSAGNGIPSSRHQANTPT